MIAAGRRPRSFGSPATWRCLGRGVRTVPRDALGLGDYPAVGDWVVVEARHGRGRGTIHAVLERRSAIARSASDSNREEAAAERRAGPRRERRRRAPRRGDRSRAEPPTPRALHRPRLGQRHAARSSSSTRRTCASRSRPPSGRSRASPSAIDVHPVSALAGTGMDAGDRAPRARPDRGRARPVGRRQVDARRCHPRHRPPGHERRPRGRRRGRHTTTHRELIPVPGGALLIDTPGIRSLELLAAMRASRRRSATSRRWPPAAASPTAGTAASRAARVRVALADGSLDAGRWRTTKARREVAHVTRSTDRLAREAERRRWATISRSVNEHMKRKYGED